jgi:hypothetical protein
MPEEPHRRLRWLGERQFAFLHGCGREFQSSQDVSPFQIRVVDENLLDAAACRELAQHSAHRYPVSRMQGKPLIRFGLIEIRS